jgi:hypothetical protein
MVTLIHIYYHGTWFMLRIESMQISAAVIRLSTLMQIRILLFTWRRSGYDFTLWCSSGSGSGFCSSSKCWKSESTGFRLYTATLRASTPPFLPLKFSGGPSIASLWTSKAPEIRHAWIGIWTLPSHDTFSIRITVGVRKGTVLLN